MLDEHNTIDIITCRKCHTNILLLIHNTSTLNQLEDDARVICAQNTINLPTWIIGQEVSINTTEDIAPIVKIWPQKESVTKVSSIEFNAIIKNLSRTHCDV